MPNSYRNPWDTTLIPSRPPEVAAVILPAQQLARLRVHGDALAVRPVPVFDVQVIAHRTQSRDRFCVEARLQVELVGQVLVVEARSVDSLDRKSVV